MLRKPRPKVVMEMHSDLQIPPGSNHPAIKDRGAKISRSVCLGSV